MESRESMESTDCSDDSAKRRQTELNASLDAKVYAECKELESELDNALSSVQEWRKREAARLEAMRQQLQQELKQQQQSAAVQDVSESGRGEQSADNGSPRSSRRRKPLKDTQNENVGSVEQWRVRWQQRQQVASEASSRRSNAAVAHQQQQQRPSSAAAHLAQLTAETPAPADAVGQENTANRALAASLAAKTEGLHQADEELERAALKLTSYSQGLDDVLARLQALG